MSMPPASVSPARVWRAAPLTGGHPEVRAQGFAARSGSSARSATVQNMGVEMPAPRKPLALARMSGAVAKNPARYRSRTEPMVADPLGDPPAWLTDIEADAWSELNTRLPWLNCSHRAIVEIASVLQGRFRAGDLGVPGLQLLRVVLGQLGATPATAHHGALPEAPSDDPAARYFR